MLTSETSFVIAASRSAYLAIWHIRLARKQDVCRSLDSETWGPLTSPRHCRPDTERSEREGSAVVLRHCVARALSGTMRGMHEGSYFTYMMASRSRTLYIGVTGNLLKRVFEHKWREHEGFTAR